MNKTEKKKERQYKVLAYTGGVGSVMQQFPHEPESQAQSLEDAIEAGEEDGAWKFVAMAESLYGPRLVYRRAV